MSLVPTTGDLVEVINPFVYVNDLPNKWLGLIVGETSYSVTVLFSDDNIMEEYRKSTINNAKSNNYTIMNILSKNS